jgi:hypothetical protein
MHIHIYPITVLSCPKLAGKYRTNIYIYTYIYTYIYLIQGHTCVPSNMEIYMHIYICTYIYTYIYTFIYLITVLSCPKLTGKYRTNVVTFVKGATTVNNSDVPVDIMHVIYFIHTYMYISIYIYIHIYIYIWKYRTNVVTFVKGAITVNNSDVPVDIIHV